MHEVARVVDKLEMEAGEDYNLLTVSFDIADTPRIAKTGKTNLLDSMEKKIPPASWRFLVGDAANITALTKAVGFRFRREKEDFVHAGTVIFLSTEGKIVRYLPGLTLLAADVKMALVDAAEGRPRSLMTKLQRLCYNYDPEGKTYVFQVNRIVLVVTLLGLALFLAYILLKRKKVTEEEGVS
jgi:protein SCO1/2